MPPTEVVHAVGKFFRYTQHKEALIDFYNAELLKLLPVMKKQTLFRFVSSSLLFMYEGEATSKDDLHPQMKMIDFANSLPLKSKERNDIDEGYPMGLENIVSVFNKIKTMDVIPHTYDS